MELSREGDKRVVAGLDCLGRHVMHLSRELKATSGIDERVIAVGIGRDITLPTSAQHYRCNIKEDKQTASWKTSYIHAWFA